MLTKRCSRYYTLGRPATIYRTRLNLSVPSLRCVSTATQAANTGTSLPPVSTQSNSTPRKEGDISSVFLSLSGEKPPPLPPRIASQKARLVAGHRDAIEASWDRLLTSLNDEIEVIAEQGPSAIPSVDFKDVQNGKVSEDFTSKLRKRGVCVVRGVVSESEALGWKEDARNYIAQNPGKTKSFPPVNPSVYELYFSPPQLAARAHPSLLACSRFLMSFWHSNEPSAPISTLHPISYVDRLRMRPPGDAGFALGPHVDGGSVERWEDNGYGLGKVFSSVFSGNWESFDPWESSSRLPIVMDLYNGAGACSMFRMYQGWLSMSKTGPGEGTLLVNPLFTQATAYMLLRPFFKAKKAQNEGMSRKEFLDVSNWEMSSEYDSELQGAACGQCQELNDELHPHLQLERSMVHVPKVNPGDYVAWHCDTIHGVDRYHNGDSDSSVMYIPVCPLTKRNVENLSRQRDAFRQGHPGPDFPSGIGESLHKGRVTEQIFLDKYSMEAAQAMGLKPWLGPSEAASEGFGNELTHLADGEQKILREADAILQFS